MTATRLSTIVGDPVGTVREFVAAPNADWVKCDGTVVPKTTYPALAAVLPPLPLPEIRSEGQTISIDLRAVADVGGITFFVNNSTGGWTNYSRSHLDSFITAPQTPDPYVWSPPVFRGNTMFVAASDATGNPRVGFATANGSFQNTSIQTFLTGITPATTNPGFSGAWFSYGSSNEVIMRTDQGRTFAWRGTATPNTTNFVEVATSPATNRRNSLIVTSNVAVAVSNTNVWLYKQSQFISWNRSVNTSIAISKCAWTANNDFLFVANNANIYRATEAQVLTGSLGTAAPFTASANVLSIATFGSTVVVSGAGGLIGNSTDGGATFTARTSGTTNVVRCITLANTTHGIAVGDGGVIRRTTDSGASWTTVTSPVGANNFTQVVFTNGRFYACYQASGVPSLIDSTDGSSWAITSGPRGGSFVQTTNFIYIEAKRSSNSLVVFLDFPASESFELSGTTWTGPHKTSFSSAVADVSASQGPSQSVVVAHNLGWCTDDTFQNWEWSLTNPYHTSRDYIKTVETSNGAIFQLNLAHTSLISSNNGRWSYTPNKLIWMRRQPSFAAATITPAGVVVAVVDRGVQAISAPGQLISSYIASSFDGGMTFAAGSFFQGERIMGLLNDGEVLYKFTTAANTGVSTVYTSYSTDYGTTWRPVQATSLSAQSQITFHKQGQLVLTSFSDSVQGQYVTIQTQNYDPSTHMRLPASEGTITDGSYPYVKVR